MRSWVLYLSNNDATTLEQLMCSELMQDYWIDTSQVWLQRK